MPVSEVGDGRGLRVVQLLNSEVTQDGNTDDLIFDVPYLVAFASNAEAGVESDGAIGISALGGSGRRKSKSGGGSTSVGAIT